LFPFVFSIVVCAPGTAMVGGSLAPSVTRISN